MRSGVPEIARDVSSMTATERARLIRDRELSAAELVDAHLARFDEVNGTINAVVQIATDRAHAEAQAADEPLAKGRSSGRRTASRPRPRQLRDGRDRDGNRFGRARRGRAGGGRDGGRAAEGRRGRFCSGR